MEAKKVRGVCKNKTRMLLEDYESRNTRLREVMVLIEELVRKIPMAEKLLAEIKVRNQDSVRVPCRSR